MPSVQNAHHIDAYFEWLVERTGCETYRGLLDVLFHTPFWYSIAMDANRAKTDYICESCMVINTIAPSNISPDHAQCWSFSLH